MSIGIDRNFDDLTERFSTRVYGRIKGEIRQTVLWHDLLQQLPFLLDNTHPSYRRLNILDVGGGLGQFSIKLAQAGHQVHYNDLSLNMMLQAKAKAQETSVEHSIGWHNLPYQQLNIEHFGKYDLVLCHAVLEWLAQPQDLIPHLARLLASNGHLSLCFYNPAGRDYRNLIRGNFKYLTQPQQYQSNAGSLTPNNPSSYQQVHQWLVDSQFSAKRTSGIRVFTDYVVNQRGGHQSPEAVIQMELEYSSQDPYKWLGRYLHIVASLT